MKKMKNTFSELEEMGFNKEEMKSKYRKGCKFKKRINKLIEKETIIFLNAYHDIFYLNNMNFQLYGIEDHIRMYANQ